MWAAVGKGHFPVGEGVLEEGLLEFGDSGELVAHRPSPMSTDLLPNSLSCDRSHRDAALAEVFFSLRDGVLAEVENTRG